MRTLLTLSGLTLLAGCASPVPAPDVHALAPDQVKLDDGIIVALEGERVRYAGELTIEGFAALRSITDGRSVRTLTITSAGGEINAGMDFGDWTFERRLDVEVEDICLSSCANYVFPAARNKVIRPGAVVAWHGSARQRGLMEHLEQEIDGRVRSLASPQRDRERLRLRHATADYLERSQRRQDEFFQRIRVEEFVTRIGAEEYGMPGLYFLSVEDMSRFGITNVIAPTRYEDSDIAAIKQRHNVDIAYLKLRPFTPCHQPLAQAAATLAALDDPRCAGIGH